MFPAWSTSSSFVLPAWLMSNSGWVSHEMRRILPISSRLGDGRARMGTAERRDGGTAASSGMGAWRRRKPSRSRKGCRKHFFHLSWATVDYGLILINFRGLYAKSAQR